MELTVAHFHAIRRSEVIQTIKETLLSPQTAKESYEKYAECLSEWKAGEYFDWDSIYEDWVILSGTVHFWKHMSFQEFLKAFEAKLNPEIVAAMQEFPRIASGSQSQTLWL